MTTWTTGDVVVGVSPRSGSPSAIGWAAAEARLRGARLRAVMAWRSPTPSGAVGTHPTPGLAAGHPDPAEDAEERLRTFVVEALGSADEVDCSVVRGGELAALTAAAAGAALLVIGEPGPGRAGAVRAGLVAPQLLRKASCPVVVMPATT